MGVAITGLLRAINLLQNSFVLKKPKKCTIRKEQHNWKTQHLNKDLIIFELFFVIRLKNFSVFGLFLFWCGKHKQVKQYYHWTYTWILYVWSRNNILVYMQAGAIDKSKIKSAERNEPSYDIILTKRTRLKAFQSVK